jgi:aldose 1-epimerase
MKILKQGFGVLNGQTITAYTLMNDRGMEVTSLDYGCIITRILAHDQNGILENVVLGFDSIEEYVEHSPYFGAVVGRFAGRIKGAEFELNGKTYRLAQNDNGNHLHGGLQGFDKVVWRTELVENEDSVSLVFSYLSRDGEEGYPGNLQMKVTYTLNNNNELIISYEGRSDQTTLLNVTNHSYFNLSGDLRHDILNHHLTIQSSKFLELDEKLIPTGQLPAVEHTPFDFKAGRKIKDGTVSDHPQNILAGKGYDHPFILDENNNNEIVLKDEESGRMLTIETDEPAVVLYTGNQLEDHFSIRDVRGRKYLGLCLETQGLPDSIHHMEFPSNILEKDKVFRSETKYKFSVFNV